MLIFFFFFIYIYRTGIVHREFFRPTSEAKGINGQRYLDILKWLCARIAHVMPELFAANSWVLHHDMCPPHMSSYVVADWLVKNRTTQSLHSPYLPDMPLCDFWAFPKVEKALKNVHWESVEEIDRVTT